MLASSQSIIQEIRKEIKLWTDILVSEVVGNEVGVLFLFFSFLFFFFFLSPEELLLKADRSPAPRKTNSFEEAQKGPNEFLITCGSVPGATNLTYAREKLCKCLILRSEPSPNIVEHLQ